VVHPPALANAGFGGEQVISSSADDHGSGGGDGLTANDVYAPDTGPNRFQYFPVMTAAMLSGGTLTISYNVPSSRTKSASSLAVEFFLADGDG
jgi:hypothetical protein